MTKPALLQWENLDDRREVWSLLAKLPPRDRYRFVRWCGTQSKGQRLKPPPLLFGDADRARIAEAEAVGGVADVQVTNDCYGLLWSLATQWGLDLDAATGKLVALARGRLTVRELEAGA